MRVRQFIVASVFLMMSMFNAFVSAQDCNVLSKANDIHPDKYCAPVSVDWLVTYRGVMNISNDADVAFVFDWGDGNTETIPFGVGPGFVNKVASKDYQATLNHVYIQGLNGTCNYRPQVWLQIDGVICTSSGQEQNVTVWDVDNANGGILTIEEPVVYVCVGSDTTVVFRDVSQWNCVPPTENDHQNNLDRWTQWIYGTGGTTLTNVRVGGVNYSSTIDGPVDLTAGPVITPSDPAARARAIYVPPTTAADIGKRFYVTLNNWNFCNQYPGNDPIFQTAYIEIVDIPHPAITFNNPADKEVCQGRTVRLNGTPAGGIWSSSNGRGFDDPNVGRFNSAKAGPGNHTITYTYIGNGDCVGSAQVNILVNPRPNISTNVINDVYLCPGTQFDFLNTVTSGTAPYDYIWTGDTDPLSATDIKNPRFYSETPGKFDVKIRVEDQNQCSRERSMSFTVSDVSMNFEADSLTLCQGEVYKLKFNVTGGSGNYTYAWLGDIAHLSGADSGPDFNATAPGQYKLYCKVVDDGNCSFEDSIVVSVTEMPVPIIKRGDRSVCGFSTTVEAKTGLGTPMWQALNNAGNISIKALNDTLAEILVNQSGTYEIERLEDNNGCVATTSVNITFIENPVPFAGTDVDICDTSYILLGVPSVGNGVWSLADGPGILSFDDQLKDTSSIHATVPGDYNIVWQEDNNGCVGRDTVTIRFNALPVADFQMIHNGNCSPLSVGFNNTSTDADFYMWTFEDDAYSNEKNPDYIYTVPVMQDSVYTVTLDVRSSVGCEDQVTKQLDVYPRPVAKLVTDYVPSCSPALVDFENQSIGGDDYHWNYGDGVVEDLAGTSDVSHSYINQNDSNHIKTFYVNLLAKNNYGCVDSSNLYLMVYPEADYEFVFSGNPICESSSVGMNATVGGKLYNWDFGDGKTLKGSNPIVSNTYFNPGSNDTTYTVKLEATSFFGCSDTHENDLTVYPAVNADFDLDRYEGAGVLDVNLFDKSKNGDTYIVDWGDGAQDTFLSLASLPAPHQFVNTEFFPKVFNVNYLVYSDDGCRDSIRKQVKVFPGFEVDFGDIAPACGPVQVRFENLSSPGGSYVWDFGDGSAEDKTLFPVHTFESVGNDNIPDTFIVSLKGTSMWGYSDSIQKEVVVWPTPDAKWNVFSTNKPGDVVTLENTSIGGSMFYWNLDDGEGDTTTIIDTKQKLFPNSQPIQITKAVKLVAENTYGCRDSVMENISVNPVVESSFIVDTVSCTPLKTVAVSNSIGAVYYEWSLDGAPYEAGDARYLVDLENSSDATEVHTLSLKVRSVYGDESVSAKNLYVKPMPRAAFIAPTSGVSPMSIVIENESMAGDSYSWSFGNGDSTFSTTISDINYSYTNTSDAPLSYQISLLAGNNEGCYDSVFANTIVYPEVVADFDCPEKGCPPLSVTFEDKSKGALYYEWTIDGSETYYGRNLRYEFKNETLIEKKYTVHLKVESAYGYTDTISKVIKILPMVVADFEPTSGGISPFLSEFTNNSVNAATAEWNFGDGSPFEVLGGSNNTSHNYSVNTKPKAYNARLSVTSPEGCLDSANASIMVYPPMEVSFICPEQGCAPFDVDFENTSSGTDLFEWNFGDGSSHWLSKDAFHRFENNTTDPVTYTVELIGQSKYGFADTFKCDVTIFPRPKADFYITPVGDAPMDANVRNLSQYASKSTWYFPDEVISDAASEFTYLFENTSPAPLSRNISLLVENTYGCTDSVSQTVTVFPPVIADFEMIPEGCSPLTVAFDNKSIGALRYKWDFGDGSEILESTSPVHVFENTSTEDVVEYNITMIAMSQFGYSDTLIKTVKVMPVPKADFEMDKVSGCAPLDLTIQNNSEGIGTYVWHFDEASLISDEAILSYRIENENFLPSYTEVSLKITNEWGCADEALKIVEAYPQVIASFEGDTIGCSPFMASMSNVSKNASDFHWEIDGINDFRQHPLVQFDNASDSVLYKDVLLVATSGYGCSDTAYSRLTVLPEPTVSFSLVQDVGSSPFVVTMVDQTENIVNYHWNFGDGDTLLTTEGGNRYHTYYNDELTPIGRKIELIGTNKYGCVGEDSRSLSVFPLVNADFNATLEGCSPLVIDFENMSRGATRFEWMFGDGTPNSVAANPSHVYESDDTESIKSFEVKMIAFSQYGLTDTMVKMVQVHPTPKAEFEINTQGGCSPVDVRILNQVEGTADLEWSLGHDSTFTGNEAVIEHTFINNDRAPVYQNVVVKAKNQYGCSSQLQKVVEVLPGINAEFVCDTVGCSPHITVFMNKSFNASHYQWSFGDGEFSQENTPTHTYVNKTAHDSLPDVSLVASNGYGCKDTFIQQLTIYPEPDFDFEIFPKEVTMPMNEVTIEPTIRNSGPWQFVWDFGDGNSVETEEPGTHTYDEWGNYDIKVRVYDERCSDTQLKGVTVNPAVPYAEFKAPPSVCAPAVVQFENTSEPGLADLWDFGDGNLSSEENPSHTYFQPGAYEVSLMVFNEIGHSDTFRTVINVYRGVNADFMVTPRVINSFSQEARFQNFSENAVEFDWDFGDGDYSSEAEPLKKYDREGAFNIQLIAVSEDGCRDTMVQEAAVKVSDVYSIRFPNAFVPSRGGSTGGGYEPGDPGSNNVFYPVLDYGNIKEYRLMIFNRWGLQVFESTDVYTGWDGYFRGELTPQGVYVWKVRALFHDGNEVVKTGDVTLIR